MKRLAVLLLLLGVLLGIALVAGFGISAVGSALLSVGWGGFALLCALHLSLIALNGVAWHVLLPGALVRQLPLFMWARMVRTAASDVLPLSQLGGPVAGIRLSVLYGISGAVAAASVIVDVTIEFLAQICYAVLALFILIAWRPDSAAAWPALAGVVAAGGLAVGLLLVQRGGRQGVLGRVAGRFGRRFAKDLPQTMDEMYATLEQIHQRRARLGLAFFLHLVEWIATGFEAWLALRLIHAPVTMATALGIEGLVYAIRGVAFMVPNAAGIQEGAYLLLGAAFGLPPDYALALSLLKRARDLALGIPALLGWQALEGRRMWRSPATEHTSTPKDEPGGTAMR